MRVDVNDCMGFDWPVLGPMPVTLSSGILNNAHKSNRSRENGNTEYHDASNRQCWSRSPARGRHHASLMSANEQRLLYEQCCKKLKSKSFFLIFRFS